MVVRGQGKEGWIDWEWGELRGVNLSSIRQWPPTPVLLPGKSHGQRSLVGWVHGIAKSWIWLSDFTFTFHFHALEKEMATHSSVLARRIQGMAEPGALPSMVSHRVGHDWSDLAVAWYPKSAYMAFVKTPTTLHHKKWTLVIYGLWSMKSMCWFFSFCKHTALI